MPSEPEGSLPGTSDVQPVAGAHEHARRQIVIEAMLVEAIDHSFTNWTEMDIEDVRRVGMAVIHRRRRAKSRGIW